MFRGKGFSLPICGVSARGVWEGESIIYDFYIKIFFLSNAALH